MAPPPFRFKRFRVAQDGAAHPLGTDSVLLGAWADVAACGQILDIGAGTGAVALMLAQRSEPNPDARIDAVEIDPASARCAAANFAASPWADRLAVWETPIQRFAEKAVRSYDLIVSNPPYFTETVRPPDLRRRSARTTEHLTADDLLRAVSRLLAPGGKCCVILPPAAGRRFCEKAVLYRLFATVETAVCARPGLPVERLLLQLERDPRRFRRDELCIYREAEIYSAEFQALTRDFYTFW